MSDYVMQTDDTTLKLVRKFPCSVEKLWQFLVKPELRCQWLCGGAVGSSAGASIELDFNHEKYLASSTDASGGCSDPIYMQGEILAYEENKLLSFTWPGEDEASFTIVTMRLSALDSGVELILTHENLTNKDFIAGASAGWHTHIGLLTDLINGDARRDFWTIYKSLESHYTASGE